MLGWAFSHAHAKREDNATLSSKTFRQYSLVDSDKLQHFLNALATATGGR